MSWPFPYSQKRLPIRALLNRHWLDDIFWFTAIVTTRLFKHVGSFLDTIGKFVEKIKKFRCVTNFSNNMVSAYSNFDTCKDLCHEQPALEWHRTGENPINANNANPDAA